MITFSALVQGATPEAIKAVDALQLILLTATERPDYRAIATVDLTVFPNGLATASVETFPSVAFFGASF